MARAAQKYEPIERLKAASTCGQRSWGVGTWLSSKEWRLPRQIQKFERGEFVSLKGQNGQPFRTMSFPTDVRSILDPRPSKKTTTVFLVCTFRADYSRRDDPNAYRMDKIVHAALSRPSAKRLQACEHEKLNGIAAENNEIRIVEIEAEQ